MTDLRTLSAEFRAALIAAQAERPNRPDLVTVDGEPEREWVVYERSVMHRRVNAYRARVGLPEVPLAAVVRAEWQSAGHFDYTQKFAFYCAELALKED